MTRRPLWLAGALLASAVVEGQAPLFRAQVDLVRLDVSVRRSDRPVAGLRADDFVLTDNGRAQRIESASLEAMPLSVTLVLDTSGSMAGTRFGNLVTGAKDVLKTLGPEDRVALMTFSSQVSLEVEGTGDIARVDQALDELTPHGGTSLRDAVYAALKVSPAPGSRGVALVFSDGVDTASWLSPAQVIETAKRSDAVVYALSPKDAGSATFLRDLADQTGGSAFEVDSLQQLASRFVAILEEFRHRYLLSYSPKGVQPGGWHKLEVRVKNRRATVKARPGYVGR
jgi:Ca-activated chloride channel family protein